MDRALGDPSAKVRAWAAKATSRLPLTPADSRDPSDSDVEVDQSIGRASKRTDPPTLFDL